MRRPNLMFARFAFVFSLFSAATESAAVAPVRDPGFRLNGTVRTGDAGSPAITPTSVIGLPDGCVVVAGTSLLNAGNQTTILRSTATGLPDPSFNTTGWMTNVVSGTAILPDGKRDIAYRIAGLPQAIVPRPLSLAQDNAANVYLVCDGEDAQLVPDLPGSKCEAPSRP